MSKIHLQNSHLAHGNIDPIISTMFLFALPFLHQQEQQDNEIDAKQVHVSTLCSTHGNVLCKKAGRRDTAYCLQKYQWFAATMGEKQSTDEVMQCN